MIATSNQQPTNKDLTLCKRSDSNMMSQQNGFMLLPLLHIYQSNGNNLCYRYTRAVAIIFQQPKTPMELFHFFLNFMQHSKSHSINSLHRFSTTTAKFCSPQVVSGHTIQPQGVRPDQPFGGACSAGQGVCTLPAYMPERHLTSPLPAPV